jgi:hypothetical protein
VRQISFSRPNQKVRGIKRRLRALDRWVDSFEQINLDDFKDGKYFHWKLPVLDRLVNRPTATKALQKSCFEALLKAAASLSKNKTSDQSEVIVTVLVTQPDMFSSQICVFFDKDYFNEFYHRDDEWGSLNEIIDNSLADILRAKCPAGFLEKGFLYQTKEQDEERTIVYESQWWLYSDKELDHKR